MVGSCATTDFTQSNSIGLDIAVLKWMIYPGMRSLSCFSRVST